jgi:GNAT superfamily N-acetyltransferase
VTISVRRLWPDDWSVYREVRLAALSEATYEREVGADDAVWRDRLGTHAQFVAEMDGAVAGTAGGLREPDGTAALISMWVAPHARGKGAGDALVKAVAAWARAEGFDALRLWVVHGNDRAEALYRRWSFAPTGRVKPVRSDPSRTEFEMELLLSEAPPEP